MVGETMWPESSVYTHTPNCNSSELLRSAFFEEPCSFDSHVARHASREISSVIFHRNTVNSSRNLDRRLGKRSWEEIGGEQRVKGQ